MPCSDRACRTENELIDGSLGLIGCFVIFNQVTLEHTSNLRVRRVGQLFISYRYDAPATTGCRLTVLSWLLLDWEAIIIKSYEWYIYGPLWGLLPMRGLCRNLG